jgi:hypothetical protein
VLFGKPRLIKARRRNPLRARRRRRRNPLRRRRRKRRRRRRSLRRRSLRKRRCDGALNYYSEWSEEWMK